MKYQIIHADGAMDLQELVAEAMEKGWIPTGGVAVLRIPSNGPVLELAFYQALMRPDRDPV